MKIIEVDDQLYHFIASKTENIGEQASDILRRLLGFEPLAQQNVTEQSAAQSTSDEEIEVVIPTSQMTEQGEASQGENIKTTTPKAQKAKNDDIVGEQVEDGSEAKVSTAAKKVKVARRKSKTAKGPSEEVLNAPVNGLPMPELAEHNTAVNRFMYILDCLHSANQASFNRILQVQGRDRLYFSESYEELKSSGSSTNPKQIGDTGYWVLTNSNTGRKRWMLAEVAKLLGYNAADIELITNKV